MAQDNDQTPDQVAAGAYPTPEQRDQGGLVDALRSRGTLPSGLAGMMMPPQVGPNAGLGFGSGVLNAQAGINHYGNVQHSQNPYMDDMYRQSVLQAKINESQMHAAQQQMQLQEQMRERQGRELNLSRKMLEDLIPTLPAGPAKDQKLQEYAGIVSKMTGSPLTADFKTAILNRNIDPKEINSILDDVASGKSMALVQQLHPGVPPQKILELVNSDPKSLMQLGADKDVDRRARLAERELKSLKLVQEQYPHLAGHPEMFPNMLSIGKKLTGGLSWEETPQNMKDLAYEQAKYNAIAAAEAEEGRKNAQKLALYGQERALDLQKELALIPAKEASTLRINEAKDKNAFDRQQAKLDADAEKAKAKGLTLTEQKNRQQIVIAETLIKNLKEAIPAIEKEGFLPADGGQYERQRAKSRRGEGPLGFIPGYSEPNNEAWTNWQNMQGNMVGWARNVEGEIGARFKGAFEQDFKLFSDPPTRKGLDMIIKRMEGQLKAIKDDQALMRGEAPMPQNPLNRQVRIRDTKTGKTGTATLAPGEVLPDGIEEIK